jgi:hypothetical protein
VLNTPFKVEPQDYGIITRKDEPLTEAAREFADTLLEFARLRREAAEH